ncbi:hypothetical protein LG197_26900 [Pseudomonas asiatica]|uniref:Uncharacterized protein n=1 Tax=Pseudomonas putida TaxID=303 RepID=A0A2S3X1H6_PSEPU|nr:MULTISPECIES: DUF6555 family protein [Pseudomonas]MCL8303131.1 hypothetical protein [Pseudomonas mosselii]MCL8339996.1 hypothetical protein [Pseudomonas mosselii]POG09416.1 hypothetical protein BGP84_06615 [Pseudomonas putida]POG15560.1 hypothetical protein BGP85_05100 [Pseudomonas putida]WDM88173.1 hypothetical protein LG197_26900 [Pseudomonas asiatica]
MPISDIFLIAYKLHGEAREFIVRAERMNNAEAWHWAACEAGVGVIPKFTASDIRKVSRPVAERFGITDVQWRRSATL